MFFGEDGFLVKKHTNRFTAGPGYYGNDKVCLDAAGLPCIQRPPKWELSLGRSSSYVSGSSQALDGFWEIFMVFGFIGEMPLSNKERRRNCLAVSGFM